jgi:nickel-dependent lactate racemase
MKTVTVCLPYGEGHLEAEIPERYITSIIKPREMTPLENPHEELERSLVEPIGLSSLFKLAEDSQNPCIIVSDSTRPTPSGLIVSSVLNTLNKAGIKDRAVSVIVATGLHRPSSGPELVERLGAFVLKRVKPENHDAYDEANLVDLGETSKGTPILINRKVHESDLIIGDGYIEPHFFAGYTGGGKNILPGVSGFETVKVNHGAIMIDHPKLGRESSKVIQYMRISSRGQG